MIRGLRSAFAGLVAVLFATGCAMPDPITVMSFNVRYGTAEDGVNSWSLRRELVVATIRERDPDLIGLQEVLAFQAAELQSALPEYRFVGVGRDDGRAAGEFVPIFYRQGRLELLGAGHFWLSEDPRAPGSIGWDAALPRMATWARLRFKDSPQNELILVNTHFDHAGETARVESARLVRRMVESMGGKPTVVTGDFNAEPGSRVYEILTENRGNLLELRDAHAHWAEEVEPASGTYHGFSGKRDGRRIDWILHSRRLTVLDAGVDQTPHDGRYASDHFAVWAVLKLTSATRFSGM